MDTHPWAILPTLVQADILTTSQAKDIVLGTTQYNRIMSEIQQLCTDAQVRGEDVIQVRKLMTSIAKVQMQESPSY